MNCKLSWASLVILLPILSGCAVHNSNAFRTVVEPSCLLAPIVIEDCEGSGESLYCRKVKLSYHHGCEKIEVIQAKKDVIQAKK